MLIKNKSTWLVFTDMDGSLLDHFNYQFDDAQDSLNRLAEQNIPVIPITSKTQAELEYLRKDLDNHHPFIIENGAAIYIPIDYFKEQPTDTTDIDNYWVKRFVKPRATWQELIDQVRPRFEGKFKTFAEMSLSEIVELTGLKSEQASRAAKRQYGEPISWQGNCKEKRDFINDLEKMGANILEGGRFLHVSGKCDKGIALTWLKNSYQEHSPNQKITSLALGDSNNDIAMLETSDYATLIQSPVHELPIVQRKTGLFVTTSTGPKGWSEGISNFIPTG